MKEVVLGWREIRAIVDDADYERVSGHRWYLHPSGYVHRDNSKDKGHYYLHRFILDAPKGTYVDHRNRDKLNNKRENLRITTNALNVLNGKMRKNNTSGYKGVGWNKRKRQWEAKIMINRKTIHLGHFERLDDAIAARKAMDQKYGVTEALPVPLATAL